MQLVPDARKVDLIWNMTLICPWDCQICCVDAVHVSKKGGEILLRSSGLGTLERLPVRQGAGSIFDQALAFRQSEGLELDLQGKLRVLDHLEGMSARLDLSGGDVLVVSENLEVLRVAAARFGRGQITLTATGAGLSKFDATMLSPLIGELNFTYDSARSETQSTRPSGYAAGNLRKAAEFAGRGVHTRAECPLTLENISDEAQLTAIYLNLRDAGIDKLLLMRLFPVGRGTSHGASVPNPDQYRRAISLFRDLEAKISGPAVKIQCALRGFDEPSCAVATANPCDLMTESFGLTPNGTLLASPWAVDGRGRPIHDAFVLGNLATTPLSDILQSEKALSYMSRLDENHGHCKIFSFLHSKKENAIDRLFDVADPLITTRPRARVLPLMRSVVPEPSEGVEVKACRR